MRRGCFLRAVSAAALLLSAAPAARAQDGADVSGGSLNSLNPAENPAAAPNTGSSNPAAADKAALAKALAEAQRDIQLSEARRAELAAEADTLKNDERKLSEALANAAQAERAADEQLNASAARLADLMGQKQAQQAVLNRRRAEMAEILAGLEKLGFNPPPAMLADAGDIAQSLHAAVLMGALVPQMKSKVQAAQAEADRLAAIQASLDAEQKQLEAKAETRREEQARLNMLLKDRAALREQKRRGMAQEDDRREKLAAKAQSLADLMDEVGKQPPAAESGSPQIALAAKFSSLKGALPRPVEGRIVTAFGKKGEDGSPARGETVAAKPGALVLSPADGTARYAGDFRSYGRILILDAGENYYIVLAGMDKLHVTQGQFVLQGEPVGEMEAAPAGAKGGGGPKPKLYIELRRGNKPVNPAPWWAADNAGAESEAGG